MRSKMLLFLLILSVSCSFAQLRGVLDSLNKELTKAKSDTLKVQILAGLSFELYASHPTQSDQYIKEGLNLARELAYQRGIALCLNIQGLWYYFQGDNSKAMDAYLSSLRISEANQYNDLTGINLSRIGDIEREQGNLHEAYRHQKKAIQLLRKSNNKYYLLYALQRMGLLLEAQNNYQKALDYFHEAIKIAESAKMLKQIAITWYYIAEVHLKKKEYKQALQYFEKSIELNKNAGSIILEASASNHITKIYIHFNQLEKAMEYSQKALNLAQSVNAKAEIQNAYNHTYLIYKQRGNLDSALKYYEKAVSLKDSMFNENKNKQIHQLQSNYEIQKKQLEIEKQAQEIVKQNFLLYSAVGGFVLIVIVAGLLYRNNIQKKKAYALLQQQQLEIISQKEQLQLVNEEIAAMNDQLEDMIELRTQELNHSIEDLMKQNQDLEQFSYIVSHNLRAPVARILGLLNILEKQNLGGEYNQGILLHLENVSLDLDTIIKDLTNIISIRKGLDQSKEKVNLKKLTLITLEHFYEDINKNEAKILVEVSENEEIFSIKSYVQSIIYNLISNAIKYRSPERRLHIQVNTHRDAKYVIYSVHDNGLGLDLEQTNLYKVFGLYQRMHIHVEGKGLGLFLVKTQLDALQGKIELQSELNVGSIFKVFFPHNAAI